MLTFEVLAEMARVISFGAPVPLRAILCDAPLVPLDEKLRDAAARASLPVGVKRTVNAQLPPTATDVQVFPISENSAAFPEMGGVAAVTVKGALPEFVRVKTLSELAAKAAGDSTAAKVRAVMRERKPRLSMSEIQI
jgi:hypothetical protein